MPFLKSETARLKTSIEEYYEMFPEAVGETSQVFMTMLKQKDFFARDYEACKKCIAEGAIDEENALQLNRMVCVLYEGYIKTVLDKPLPEEEVDAKADQFVADVDWIVMHHAKDLKGYRGYGK